LLSFARLVAFILPAYVANAVPVVFGGGAKIDFGRKFYDGRRVLGDGKTVNGLVSGLAFGTLAGLCLALALPSDFLPFAPSLNAKIVVSFMLALGALIGDLVGSFFKRRMGVERGEPSMLMDQLLFLFFALAFAASYYPLPSIYALVVLVLLTFLLHVLFNALAHKLKLKSVPW